MNDNDVSRYASATQGTASRTVGGIALGALLASLAASAVAGPPPVGKDAALEARFDAAIDPAEMDGGLKTMSAAPSAFTSSTVSAIGT